MYKLNTNSLSARFYSWVWNTEVTKFKTMCAYFWKYVLTILFLPVILIGKLLYYLTPAKKTVGKGLDYVAESKVGQATGNVLEKIGDQEKVWDVTGKIFKWAFFIVTGAFALLMIIVLCVVFYAEPVGGLTVIGALALIFLALIGIVFTFDKYSIGSKIAYPFKLFGNMCYSLYKNICPIIRWE